LFFHPSQTLPTRGGLSFFAFGGVRGDCFVVSLLAMTENACGAMDPHLRGDDETKKPR